MYEGYRAGAPVDAATCRRPRRSDNLLVVSKWRIWLRSGMGETPSQELVAAMAGLGGRDRLRARRLVRRGEAAEDVAVARYVVAFARERQRRYARFPSLRVSLAVCVVLGLGIAVLSADAFARSKYTQGVLFGGFAAFFLVYCGWRGWQERRNVEAAEQNNREFLRRAGAPYVPGGPPTSVYVPPLAVACSLALYVAVLVPVGGLVTMLLDGESLSSGRAFSGGLSGAAGAAIAAVFGVVSARSRDQGSGGRSAAEYQHLRDLD